MGRVLLLPLGQSPAVEVSCEKGSPMSVVRKLASDAFGIPLPFVNLLRDTEILDDTTTVDNDFLALSVITSAGDDKAVRRALESIHTFGSCQDPRIVRHVSDYMKHPVWQIRTAAAQALGKIGEPGDRESMNVLMESFDDAEWNVRRSAALALGSIASGNGDCVLNRLIALINDENEHVREAAVEVLGELSPPGNRDAIEAVCKAVADYDQDVAYAAVGSLERVTKQHDEIAIALLQDSYDHTTGEEVRDVLAQALRWLSGGPSLENAHCATRAQSLDSEMED